MNIHHCCHTLDKKSPVPVNHGRPSKSNVGDIYYTHVLGILLHFTRDGVELQRLYLLLLIRKQKRKRHCCFHFYGENVGQGSVGWSFHWASSRSSTTLSVRPCERIDVLLQLLSCCKLWIGWPPFRFRNMIRYIGKIYYVCKVFNEEANGFTAFSEVSLTWTIWWTA